MNRYTWEELLIGMEDSFQVTITANMMNQFKEITGDSNPLHGDEEFAGQKGYQGRVVFGMLTASFLSTLAGVYLPGEKSLIQTVETKFVKPVYVGDSLTVTGVIAEKEERFGYILLKVGITNDKGEKVLRGSMQIGVK